MRRCDLRNGIAEYEFDEGLKVCFRPHYDGIEIYIPEVSENPVAYIDLYYFFNPDEGEWREAFRLAGGTPLVQMLINDPRTEDAVGSVLLYKDRTLVDFDAGAEILANSYPIGVIGLDFPEAE